MEKIYFNEDNLKKGTEEIMSLIDSSSLNLENELKEAFEQIGDKTWQEGPIRDFQEFSQPQISEEEMELNSKSR